jgi:gamma-glutamylcyclotransferase (GGCT)/AIG2-like uncharacterized protein YtfP
MDEICRYLFIYGTLMAADTGALGREQRARLQRESRSLGASTLTGARLYNLGRYPGLVECGAAGDVVHGEVVALANPARSFFWLDAYEGVIPDKPDASDYARIERMVRLDKDGIELTAWVYVFLKDVANRRAIASGRW